MFATSVDQDSGHKGASISDMVRSMEILAPTDQEASALAHLEQQPAFDTTALGADNGNFQSQGNTRFGVSQLDRKATTVSALDGRASYSAHFGGLQDYGGSGMTVLEELVDAALRASDRAVAAGTRIAHGAALVAKLIPESASHTQGPNSRTQRRTLSAVEDRDQDDASGRRIIAACSVESISDPGLSVGAERACMLQAVGAGLGGLGCVEAMVIATSHGEAFPVPDGPARQFLAEYGDFPIFLVNRHMKCKRTSTYALYPLAAAQAMAQRERQVLSMTRAAAAVDSGEDIQRVSAAFFTTITSFV